MTPGAANNSGLPESDRMARALELAELGLYTTDPNPRVGCVLVRDGQVVLTLKSWRCAPPPDGREAPSPM
jgi:hypothetical protein